MQNTTGTIETLIHDSKILEDNPLEDASRRELIVYLPPGYHSENKDLPTVYFLTGFTGRGKMLLNDSPFTPNLAERIDRLIERGAVKPFIGVLPNCFTRYGGSQYINSSATGQYEDYLIDEIVPFVDERFRTIADRGSRAVTGISSGGYGSMIMGMRHPDVFGMVASIAGDCLFDMCYRPDLGKAFRGIKGDPLSLIDSFYEETAKQGKHAFDGLNAIGMSACYSPNPDSDHGFELPFDLKTGLLREDVWARWLEHDPYYLADKHGDDLGSLALFYLDAGDTDEFYLDIGAKALAAKLKKMGIEHTLTSFDGGHFNIKYRFEPALVAISDAISS